MKKRHERLMGVGVIAVAIAVSFTHRTAGAADLTLPRCGVKHVDDVQLPAMEAGALVQLAVREGSQVREGDVLGKIYDSEVLIQKRAADFALTAAVKRWENDVQIRYAKASADVALAKFEKMKQANENAVNAVPEIEVRQAELEWVAATLSIEKSEHEQDLAKYDAYAKRAERDAAQLGVERRTIRALFDGEVVELKRRQGEWVNPGDPILRLVSLDSMWVDGWVEQALYDPHEVQNCSATVVVEMARGRKEQVSGRITYVSSLLEDGRRFRVRAEVANREEFGRWLLRDGMVVAMTIHLDTGGAGAVDVSRAQ